MFGALVPGGTRDGAFIERYTKIKAAVVKSISADVRDALADADFTITEADASNPAVLLRTVDRHAAHHAVASGDLDREARQRHQGIHEVGIGLGPDPGVHASH